MHIVFLIGAHCTGVERLLKTLLRNRVRLAQSGIAVPEPSRYRTLLREVSASMQGAVADPDAEHALLEDIMDGDEAATLVLANPNFISLPAMAIGAGRFYPRIAKAAWLRNLFPSHEVSFGMAVRDPSSFIPALLRMVEPTGRALQGHLDGTDPAELRWSDTIAALRQTCPGCEVRLWCYEDTPLIWEEIMRGVCGAPDDVNLHGGFDMARPLLTEEGVQRLRAYTGANPPETLALRRRILRIYLEEFPASGAWEDEVDLPGWTDDLIDRMRADYEADLPRIASMDGVIAIAP